MGAALRSSDYYDFMDEMTPIITNWNILKGSDFFFVDNTDTSYSAEDIAVMRGVYTGALQLSSYGQELEEDCVNSNAKSLSVEGWHLALAVLAVLGGSYYFSWDSHKALLGELSGMRADIRADRKSSDDDLKKLISELKTEREADRQQSAVNAEAITEQLAKIREAQATTTEALKSLKGS